MKKVLQISIKKIFIKKRRKKKAARRVSRASRSNKLALVCIEIWKLKKFQAATWDAWERHESQLEELLIDRQWSNAA